MSDKYYWLKLKRDFFKRHDIRIVEEMPNGKEYILFYLKLLCESVDHEGTLRFSDEVPYNENMLAVITNTNVDIVRNAVKIFTELKMMEILDDGTIFLREMEGMLGYETEWAKKKREYRERQKEIEGQCPQNVLTMSDKSIEKEIEIDKEKDINNKPKRKRFVPPTLEEVKAYCSERKNNIDAEHFIDYYSSQHWKKANGRPLEDWKAAVRTWEKNSFDNKKKNVEIPVPDYMQAQIDEMMSKY